tara:strand:+ start:540 stop:1544 length:1005 start_codon:yes stop_codon:yes gene_type:complete
MEAINQMKILVVGGAGYIGGCTVDSLINNKNGHEVTVYDNLMYERMYLKPINFIAGDIRDEELYTSIVHKYDAVVWLAAIVGDGACNVKPSLTKEINYDCVKRLADCGYQGKIVFTSTCSVYGANNDLIDEYAEPNPLSLYASTKLQAERCLTTEFDEHGSLDNVLIFRLGTLFGLSDMHSRLRLDLVVNVLTKKAVKGEDLTVFGGEQWRPLLHVKDVAGAIAYGLDNDIKGLYNLSYDNFTILDLAKEIQETVENSVKILESDMSFEDMRNYKVVSDAYRAHGWSPKWTLKDGISELESIMKEGRVRDTENPVYSNAAYMGAESWTTQSWIA